MSHVCVTLHADLVAAVGCVTLTVTAVTGPRPLTVPPVMRASSTKTAAASKHALVASTCTKRGPDAKG